MTVDTIILINILLLIMTLEIKIFFRFYFCQGYKFTQHYIYCYYDFYKLNVLNVRVVYVQLNYDAKSMAKLVIFATVQNLHISF